MPSKNSGNQKITNIRFLKKKVKLTLDYINYLVISKDTYTDFNLFVGKSLSNKEIKEIRDADGIKEYINYALKLLSKANYSEKEISLRLTKKNASSSAISKVVAYLYKYSLINDDELLVNRIEHDSYMNYGKKKIIDDLYKKGISEEKIKKVKFKEKDELEKAKYWVNAYDEKLNNISYNSKRNKIYQCLLRQGFEYDIADMAMNYLSPKDNEIEKAALKEEYLRTRIRIGDKEKIVRYLLNKGYSYENINEVIGD